MAMSLNPECRSRLLALLESTLPQVMVDNGSFVRSGSLSQLRAGNDALPTKIRERFTNWVSDNPFSTFVYGVLSAKVMRDFDYQSDAETPLTQLPGYDNVASVANELLTAFESLPWSYTLLFPLPLKAHEDDHDSTREYPLTDTSSLVAPGANFGDSFSVVPGEEPISFFLSDRDAGPRRWSSDHYYLKLTVEGFIEDFIYTRPVEEASLFLRSLSGLLLASGAARSRSSYSLVPTQSPFFTYLSDGDGPHLLRSHMLPSEHSEMIRTLEWVDIPGLQGAKWPGWMNYFQDRLRPALVATHEHNSIRRAAQWYFDSKCGSSELLQFVQATVSLEILLGDKASSDVVGIAELLANRCAYLLAKNHAERARILQDLKALYSTRSAIVHRGKHRLTKDESMQLINLQHYCGLVIHKELELLAEPEAST